MKTLVTCTQYLAWILKHRTRLLDALTNYHHVLKTAKNGDSNKLVDARFVKLLNVLDETDEFFATHEVKRSRP